MHQVASKIILRGSQLTAYICSVAATKKQKAIQLGVERSITVSARRQRQPRPSTTLMVNVPHGGKSFQLKWKLGDSLKTLAEQNDELEEYIEGICGGNLSCSTCHVYIEKKEFQALLEDPVEAERDMLVCCTTSFPAAFKQKMGILHC